MAKMELDDYIEKYGIESGTKRYHGVLKLLESRKKTHELYPYRRLTKEWFIWKYPEDGELRFNNHVAKSLQSLDNFITRYGEELGTQKYNETIEKKNTVKISKEKYGQSVVDARYEKAKNTYNSKSDEYKLSVNLAKAKTREVYLTTIRGRRRIDILIEKYGVEIGTKKYQDIISKSFSGPCRMSKPAYEIYKNLQYQIPEIIDNIYCDVAGSKEYFIFDKSSKQLYSYDFTHREALVILEYNDIFWHPTEKSDCIHPVTKKTLSDMYEYDITKKRISSLTRI